MALLLFSVKFESSAAEEVVGGDCRLVIVEDAQLVESQLFPDEVLAEGIDKALVVLIGCGAETERYRLLSGNAVLLRDFESQFGNEAFPYVLPEFVKTEVLFELEEVCSELVADLSGDKVTELYGNRLERRSKPGGELFVLRPVLDLVRHSEGDMSGKTCGCDAYSSLDSSASHDVADVILGIEICKQTKCSFFHFLPPVIGPGTDTTAKSAGRVRGEQLR